MYDVVLLKLKKFLLGTYYSVGSIVLTYVIDYSCIIVVV